MRLGITDPNSYAVPEEVVITHIDFEWNVNFEKRIIGGSALLTCKIIAKEISFILLDINQIVIHAITVNDTSVRYTISDYVDRIGSKLTVYLPGPTNGCVKILIKYETCATSTGLQWLAPEQTLGKQNPFLFSHSQPIRGRTFVPCQDTPAVKFTYTAVVQYPPNLVCLMSALVDKKETGITKFIQKNPVPSYLIAIVVGNLVSRPLGPISKVWAEEALADDAANEFSETDNIIRVAESLCGPYMWGVYDLVVMPRNFPFKGMGNPGLTFLTPAVIAKNISFPNVLVHEIAHSWSGNLVTNRNWEQIWINEGFTKFIEGKILGVLKGAEFRDFIAICGLTELYHNINNQLVDTPALTRLVPDLKNVNPDDAFSLVPYIKGMTFFRYIEQCVGGDEVFNPFLQYFFEKYKFQSISGSDLKTALFEYFKVQLKLLQQIDWNDWLYGMGMPPKIPNYNRTLCELSTKYAKIWAKKKLDEIQQSLVLDPKLENALVIDVLDKLLMHDEDIIELNADKLNFLKVFYNFETEANNEIWSRYYLLVIHAQLIDKLDEIFTFVNRNFCMIFIRDIYRALGNWPAARDAAIANFHLVQCEMMPICAMNCARDLQIR